MRIFTILCLTMIHSTAIAQFTPNERTIKDDLTRLSPTQHLKNKTGPSNPVSCAGDTLQYGRYKATTLQGLNILKGYALGQYYDAPGEVTVSGFSFYGWQSSATKDSVTIVCKLYEAGRDTIPIGSPIRQATIKVDSTFMGGQLSVLLKKITFSTPYTTSKPYIITVENDDSLNRVAIVMSSWTAGDGDREWLGCGTVAGVWYNFRNLNVGGNPLDCDVMLEPHVTYKHYADFTFKNCYNYLDSVKFLNKSSGFTFNRMYNRYSYFGLDYICQRWNYGNNPFYYSVVNGGTRYTSPANYDISLISSIYGYTNNGRCDDTMKYPLFYQPSQITLMGNTVLCSGDSLDLLALGNAPMHWFRKDGDTAAFQIKPRYVSPPLNSNDTVFVRSMNGSCFSTQKRAVGEVKTTPDAPAVQHDYICLNSKANLVASTNIGEVDWFDDSLSTKPFYTGNLYETEELIADRHYFVQARNFNCTSKGKVKISAFVSADFAPKEPITNLDTTICLLNGSLELEATSPSNDTIRWFLIPSGGTPEQIEGKYLFTPTSPGKSYVYVDAFNGKCASSRLAIIVDVIHFPTISYRDTTTVCEGDTALLEAFASQGSIGWFKDVKDPLPFYDGFAYSISNAVKDETFYLESYNGSCKDTQRYALRLEVNEFGIINTQTKLSTCRDRDLTLNGSTTVGFLQWFADVDLTTPAAIGNQWKIKDVTADFKAWVNSNHEGCISQPTEIQVSTIANTDATFDFQILNWRNVQFLARKGAQGVYNWNFDDNGNTKNGENITYIFTKDGTFNVRLIVTNGSGCYDTAYRLIALNTVSTPNIEKQKITAYPNPFTESLQVYLNQGESLRLMDARGQVVLHSPLKSVELGIREINTETCKPGFYFLEVSSADQRRTVRLIKF